MALVATLIRCERCGRKLSSDSAGKIGGMICCPPCYAKRRAELKAEQARSKAARKARKEHERRAASGPGDGAAVPVARAVGTEELRGPAPEVVSDLPGNFTNRKFGVGSLTRKKTASHEAVVKRRRVLLIVLAVLVPILLVGGCSYLNYSWSVSRAQEKLDRGAYLPAIGLSYKAQGKFPMPWRAEKLFRESLEAYRRCTLVQIEEPLKKGWRGSANHQMKLFHDYLVTVLPKQEAEKIVQAFRHDAANRMAAEARRHLQAGRLGVAASYASAARELDAEATCAVADLVRDAVMAAARRKVDEGHHVEGCELLSHLAGCVGAEGHDAAVWHVRDAALAGARAKLQAGEYKDGYQLLLVVRRSIPKGMWNTDSRKDLEAALALCLAKRGVRFEGAEAKHRPQWVFKDAGFIVLSARETGKAHTFKVTLTLREGTGHSYFGGVGFASRHDAVAEMKGDLIAPDGRLLKSFQARHVAKAPSKLTMTVIKGPIPHIGSTKYASPSQKELDKRAKKAVRKLFYEELKRQVSVNLVEPAVPKGESSR
jgi:hypothetical protein